MWICCHSCIIILNFGFSDLDYEKEYNKQVSMLHFTFALKKDFIEIWALESDWGPRYQSELGLSRDIGGFCTFNFMCTTPYCLLAHGPLQINALFVTCFSQSVWDLGSILVQDKSSVRQGSGSSLVLSPCSLSGDIYTIIHVYLFC